MTEIEVKIACIGTRLLIPEEKIVLTEIGSAVVSSGAVLATGNAPGSDQAFALGGNLVDPQMVRLYLPWWSYEREAVADGNTVVVPDVASAKEMGLAKRCHPAWEGLSPSVQKLMVRNAMIVNRSSGVIAFPQLRRRGWGGTGHGMRIAQALGIDVVNLAQHRRCDWLRLATEFLSARKKGT